MAIPTCPGCCNTILQTGWLKQQNVNFPALKLWQVEPHPQGSGRWSCEAQAVALLISQLPLISFFPVGKRSSIPENPRSPRAFLHFIPLSLSPSAQTGSASDGKTHLNSHILLRRLNKPMDDCTTKWLSNRNLGVFSRLSFLLSCNMDRLRISKYSSSGSSWFN